MIHQYRTPNCEGPADDFTILQYAPITVGAFNDYCDNANQARITFEFPVNGGQPSFDASNYTLAITADATGTATIDNGPISDGGTAVVSLFAGAPIGTVIDISITDDFGCTITISYTTTFQCCIAEAGVIDAEGVCPPGIDPITGLETSAGDDFVITLTGYQTDPLYETWVLIQDVSTGSIVDAINVAGAASVSIPYTQWATYPNGAGVDYEIFAYNFLVANPPLPAPAIVAPGSAAAAGTATDAYDIGSTDPICGEVATGGEFFIPEPFQFLGTGLNTVEGVTGGLNPFYYNVHSFEIIGGNPPYEYIWEETGYVRHSITGEGQVRVIYADDAEWGVTVQDALGCGDDMLIFSNDFSNTLLGDDYIIDIESYDIVGDNPFTGAPEGSITINVTGGIIGNTGIAYTGEYDMEWSGYGGAAIPHAETVGQSFTWANLHYGWYQVHVWLENGLATENDVYDVGEEDTDGWYWVPRDIPGSRGKMDAEAMSLEATPNPFENETLINFSVAQSGTATVSLFSTNGQRILDIFKGEAEAGQMNTIDFQAGPLAAGVYLITIEDAAGNTQHEKLVLTK